MMYPSMRFFYCLGCDPHQPDHTDGETIYVCQEFLDSLWQDDDLRQCGVMRSNKCPPSMDMFDPYMCGDDLVLPKQEYVIL